jgi:uncharacterized membrane protein
MTLPTKASALDAIKTYEAIYNEIPLLIDASPEPLGFWAKELGLSNSAVSNKKKGRRDWKASEIKIVLHALKKDTKIVDNYIEVLDNIDKMIAERGFKKLFFYHKVGLSNMQIYIRNTNKNKDYFTWQIDEIKKLVEAL